MHVLQELPLLSRLSRVEMAKLVSEIHPVQLTDGEEVCLSANSSSIYFIQEGRVGVYLRSDDELFTLMVLGVGEFFGESSPVGGTVEGQLVFKAMGTATVYQLDRSRFEAILAQHPTLLREFSQIMVKRSYLLMDELARAKLALRAHAAEVWALMEDATGAMQEVSAAQAYVEPEVEAPSCSPVRRIPWRSVLNYGLPILAAAGVYLVSGPGLTITPVRTVLAALIWGVCSWLLDAVPDYVVALTIILAPVVIGIIKPELAFSGFSNRTWLLLLAVLGISAGVGRTGLLYRVALHMLKLFPPTYAGQSIALALGGLVLAPFIPGVTGRQAMASRLSVELGEAMGFKQKSKGAAGLAMACFIGFSCIYYISMTGGSVTLLVWSVLPEAAKVGISWGAWFVAALPAAVVVFVLAMAACMWIFRPDHPLRITRDVTDSQLRVLGPMSRQEWTTVFVVLAVVLSFITQPLHNVDPTWVALIGFLVLAGTRILDQDALRRGIDWGFLLLTGGLLGIAALTGEKSFVTTVSSVLVPIIRPVSGNPWTFLTAVALITAAIRLAVPFQPSILLTALALTPVAARIGYNPFVVGLVILIMASNFVIPHGNPMYMAAYGGSDGSFTHGQVRRLSLLHTAITLIAVWISIPAWQWLGLLTLAK